MGLVQGGGEVTAPQSTQTPPSTPGFGFLHFCNSSRSSVHTSPGLTAAAWHIRASPVHVIAGVTFEGAASAFFFSPGFLLSALASWGRGLCVWWSPSRPRCCTHSSGWCRFGVGRMSPLQQGLLWFETKGRSRGSHAGVCNFSTAHTSARNSAWCRRDVCCLQEMQKQLRSQPGLHERGVKSPSLAQKTGQLFFCRQGGHFCLD